jgi:uncharacterized protein (DUF2141 family)
VNGARAALIAFTGLTLVGAAPIDLAQPLSMDLLGLRSPKGKVLVCVTRRPDHFPDCRDDPDRRYFAVPAHGGEIRLGMLTPGQYAIAIVHDENGNGRLDTFAGIPREGVGFSRNPALRFGAPSFRAASFSIGGSAVEQDVRLKYFL